MLKSKDTLMRTGDKEKLMRRKGQIIKIMEKKLP